jgi:RNA polymerase sigma-70 factor (ECF subfamily)
MGEHKALKDEELIRRISDKDLLAFEQLVERYKIFVFNTCYSFLGDYHQAEDAAQDIFLQIYRSAGSFRQESKVSTWIYRIAVNRSLNLIRRNRRFRWLKSLSSLMKDEASGEEILIASSGEVPDKALEEKEKKELLQSAVDSLPEKQKVAFILHKYENLSHREISKILGISINSVEARIHRAKVNLQKKLASRLKKIP